MKQALLIIDVQQDFCAGGILPAQNTASLVSPLNAAIDLCLQHGVTCVFTRDWHPLNHCSFNTQGGPWPTHCVQGTKGAEFADGLHFPNSALVIDIEKDSTQVNMSYSAFENTNLEATLHNRGITELAACGIATDYCVKATVLDALHCGFNVSVLTDLARPIDVHNGDSAKALAEMKTAGATLLTSDKWLSLLSGR